MLEIFGSGMDDLLARFNQGMKVIQREERLLYTARLRDARKALSKSEKELAKTREELSKSKKELLKTSTILVDEMWAFLGELYTKDLELEDLREMAQELQEARANEKEAIRQRDALARRLAPEALALSNPRRRLVF